MTSQPDLQTITIRKLSKISQSKGNQKMKFRQLTECNKKNIFLQNHAEHEAARLIPDLFLSFKKD